MNRSDEIYGVNRFSNDHLTIYGPSDREDDEDGQWFIYLHKTEVIIPFNDYPSINDFVCSFREILVQY